MRRGRELGGPRHILRRSLWALVASAVIPFGTVTLVGASSPTSVTDAELTGTYNVSFHVVSPAADRRDKTTLSLAFTGGCTSGSCQATVSTLAASCVSGSCGQPPSDLTFASEELRLVRGLYKGTFTIKTGCTAQGTYYPYAYEQRTLLTIRPTATLDAGGTLQVSRFTGTLELLGSPDSIGHKWGCTAYRYGLTLAGASET